MSDAPTSGFLRDSRRTGLIRLRTLIILRWLAVLGQLAAVLVAHFYLELRFELGLCLMAIGATVITNLVGMYVYPENRRLPEREVMLTLLLDLSQLAFLLYLTGGLHNPFALLMLAPVTVSAMTLESKSTLFIGALAMVLVSVLAVFSQPLSTLQGFELRLPWLFVVGFWFAMIIGIVFLALYARRVATETSAMSRALLATQMALSREQQLTALGGVVAAAAHELGTPLATIKLVSAELLEELEDRPELREDAELIRDQADRCRDILRSMGRAGKDDLHLRNAPLSTVVQEAAEPHRDRGKELHFTFSATDEAHARMPLIRRRPEIVHGLRNLIQNAVDFADHHVWIDVNWSDEKILVRVIDDGAGYPSDLLGRIGDPFIRRRAQAQTLSERPEYEGMGLGLFIAKTLLERSGGETSFANGGLSGERHSRNRIGAIAEVTWPARSLLVPETEHADGLGENKPIAV